MKEKILIFNGYYYPSKNCGGPVTSIENIVNSCCNDYDFYIICYNHDFDDKTPFNVQNNTWITVGNAQIMYVKEKYLDFSKKRMRLLFERLKPDLVWFSGVLTPNNKIVTVFIAREIGIPVLFSPRGEVSEDRVKLKAYKKVPYLRLIKFLGIYKGCYFHATSEDELQGIKKYFAPDNNHIFQVANISIMPQKELWLYHKKKDMLKVIFFSRIHEVKNLLYAIRCVCNCKKRIIFNIYGPVESKSYWSECLEIIRMAPQNVSIHYCGVLNKANISQTIQQHDCFLFPTINENYGHVIAEALANGRPVILSRGTTPWDDLHKRAGYVIPLANPQEFTNTIDYMASFDDAVFLELLKETKQYFLEKTSADSAVSGHIRMIKSVLTSSRKSPASIS